MGPTDTASFVGGEVREDVFLHDGACLGVGPAATVSPERVKPPRPRRAQRKADGAPTRFEIFGELRRHVAACLLDVVHDVRLVHHVPLTERDELLEVVCQQLPAHIDPGRNAEMSASDRLHRKKGESTV